jgi:hypothetical protein
MECNMILCDWPLKIQWSGKLSIVKFYREGVISCLPYTIVIVLLVGGGGVSISDIASTDELHLFFQTIITPKIYD